MGEFPPNEETVREYLLGRVSDETTLEQLEDLLFTDEDFCSLVALAEDGILNDYVLGRLTDADAKSFQATLAGNPERHFKLELTQALREKALARSLEVAEDKPSFFASLAAFFHQPKYVGAFAALLIAVVVFAVYFSRQPNADELAELRSIYQQARPTETRISEFGYAPLPQLRGAPEPEKKNRLRRIENNLIEATEKNPNAKTHHALGVFNLTQQKYGDAIKELETAVKLANQNAQFHNDLGAAHFELAKTEPKEKKLADLAQSLEEFTKATELDGSFLEALFNKSLAQQELGMPRAAKESWNLYLQKDPSSQWADEARKNLARLENTQALFKTEADTKKHILPDFLAAYRDHDDARARKIHNETKGTLKDLSVPVLLARRYLVAKQQGNEADAKESVEVLSYIGNFEQTENGDSFFFELANFYANAGTDKIEPLLQAQNTFAAAQELVASDSARAVSEFEKSRDLFERIGDACEAALAGNWAAQLLPDVAKLDEARRRLTTITETEQSRNFKILLPSNYYWLGIGDYRQGRVYD
jgi:tetratricopeptide (TPR) repeat protein